MTECLYFYNATCDWMWSSTITPAVIGCSVVPRKQGLLAFYYSGLKSERLLFAYLMRTLEEV